MSKNTYNSGKLLLKLMLTCLVFIISQKANPQNIIMIGKGHQGNCIQGNGEWNTGICSNPSFVFIKFETTTTSISSTSTDSSTTIDTGSSTTVDSASSTSSIDTGSSTTLDTTSTTSALAVTSSSSSTTSVLGNCKIWYKAQNDDKSGAYVSSGYSQFIDNADRDCDDSNPFSCGIALGIQCENFPWRVKLDYWFQSASVISQMRSTPYSTNDNVRRDGSLASVSHGVKDECQSPRRCGIKIQASSPDQAKCTVSYTYKLEYGVSNTASNGSWALMGDAGGRNENCDDGYCGMQATLNCTPP